MNLGSLDKVIETINKKNLKVPFIPEIVLSQMTYQILLGLKYLHIRMNKVLFSLWI